VVCAARPERSLLQSLLSLAPLVLIGRVSYGLYLWHVPVFKLFKEHGGELVPAVAFVGKFAVTCAIVALSWRFVERPLLALKPRPSSSNEGIRSKAQPAGRTA
jgi:peptidoglycan/LPS O-acetylase OafA/YrhL